MLKNQYMRIYNMNIEKLNGKKFDLFGSTWTIKIVEELDKDKDGTIYFGTCHTVTQELIIAKYSDGKKVSEETQLITFCHELVHAIFSTGLYVRENEDEPLVEFIARSLASLIKQNLL